MSSVRKTSRLKRFLTGKGFYAVMALCLLVIAGVAFVTFSDDRSVPQGEAEHTQSEEQQVVEQVSDVPDTRTTQTTTTKTTTATTVQSQPLFVLPGSNAVAKNFSGNTPVFSKTMGDWRCHNGADFVGNEGMTVKCISDGTVKSVVEDEAFGGIVTVDHGFGVISRYCGVTATVKENDDVKAGDKLGTLSGVPCEAADGCHLHLEVTVSEVYVDPVKTIDREVRYTDEQE